MIIWGNTISTNTSRPDYAETNEELASFIKNKPDAAIKKAQDTADLADAAAGKAQKAADDAQKTADSKVAQITAELVLPASGWSGERQTLAVEGVTTINTVFIAPALSSMEAFEYYEITCVKQGNGNLTFGCEGEPDTDITLNVVILDVTVSPESGNPAVPGEDGGYYIPRVTQIDATTVRFEFTPSETDMPEVEPVTVTLPAGTGGGGSADLTGYATEAWVQAGYQPKGNYALASQIPSVPVQSVNGKTGAVKLNAADVGADSTGTASSAVSGHNVSTDAHNDIRLELQKINAKLTAFFNSDDQTLDELSEIVEYITSNKSLIDAITTSKVSVLDIVNDLVTNVPAKPLSAAQGVVLKGLIDNLSTGKLDASKLTEAINTALAQAKEAGDFDGPAGQRGNGILKVTTAPTSYTTATGGKNPIKRMSITTIKSQSGATEVLVGDQIEHSYYHYHVYYLDATYAYMDTSQSIRGATGSAGANGKNGADGYNPVRGIDYWTDEDKAEIVEEVKNSGTEPAEDDIPKVFFGGPLQQTKTEATVSFRYISKTQDISGYAVIKAQGDSSMSYPKKNQTVKLYKDADCTEKLKVDFRGWGKQNKFVFKANWIDLSHARNLVSARLWGDVVKSRGNYSEIPELLRTSPNQGAVDGFPVKVYAAGIYQGRYTLNIPKDGWMANMDDELDTHCILCGENSASAQFKASAVIDGSDWSDELHDTVPTAILNRWNAIISFVQNSTDADFKANLGNYFDVTSLIDYYLFGTAICDNDGFKKNQIYMTYDGQKWYASAYDKDSTFGLWWDASKFIAYDSEVSTIDENLLYSRLKSLFAEEIQTRWAELRASALSEANIINRFERFTDICPPWLVAEDYAATTGGGAYTAIPQQGTNNIQQIRDFIVPRLAWADVKVVGDPNLLYKLKEPVTFSNANPTGVETGVKLFDTAKDATVFISYDVTSVIASATLLYTNTGTTDWYPPGMFISTSGEYIQLGVHKTTFKGAAAADYKHLMANVNAIAIVITAGMPTLVKFREKSGTIRTWGIPTGITFAATDGTLTLGAATGNTQGLYTQGFDGTVKDFRVWNVAKTEAEINALFAEIQA